MTRLIKAFFASVAAFRHGWKHETALRQEMVVILLSLPAALLLTGDPWKLLALWGSLLLVLAVEFLNTGIEALADRITTEHDPLIGVAKDCGSAAVLVASIFASGVWLVVLWERFGQIG